MLRFINLETPYEGEELVINISEISSINSASGSNISTIILKNGTEFDVKGTAIDIIDHIGR
jgi:hypothetical protein